jgi:hypothetical protein
VPGDRSRTDLDGLNQLIEESSLGTPAAQRLRGSTMPEELDVLRRHRDLAGSHEPASAEPPAVPTASFGLGRLYALGAAPYARTEVAAEVDRLAVAYPQQPLGVVLGDLVRLQGTIFALLERRPATPDARDIYARAAMTSGMLAKASHDLGDGSSAMDHARLAYRCADRAGHDGLRAWVRGLESLIMFWAGMPERALHFARSGAQPAERAGGTMRVWVTSLEARALAQLGDGNRTLEALTRADRARDAVSANDLDDVGGILRFSLPRQLYYGADALCLLPGKAAIAERLALDALDAYEAAPPADRSFGDEAGARTDLAVARTALGDLDAVRHALAPVLDLPSAQRNFGIVASVERVAAQLRHASFRTSRASRDLLEEIAAFAQSDVA